MWIDFRSNIFIFSWQISSIFNGNKYLWRVYWPAYLGKIQSVICWERTEKTIRRNIYVTELMLKSDSVLLKIHEKNEKRKKNKRMSCEEKIIKNKWWYKSSHIFFFKLCVAIWSSWKVIGQTHFPKHRNGHFLLEWLIGRG